MSSGSALNTPLAHGRFMGDASQAQQTPVGVFIASRTSEKLTRPTATPSIAAPHEATAPPLFHTGGWMGNGMGWDAAQRAGGGRRGLTWTFI